MFSTSNSLFSVLPTLLHRVHVLSDENKLKALLFSAWLPVDAIYSSSSRKSTMFGVTIHDLLIGKSKVECVEELKEAIENLAAFWDYLIDDTGGTFFMRDVLKLWLLRLDKRSAEHFGDIPLNALLHIF